MKSKVIFEAKGRWLTRPGWRVLMDGYPTDDHDKGDEPATLIYAKKNGLVCPLCGHPLAHLIKPVLGLFQ